ncbi:MAG: HD domain-containing protein [Candidatus Nanohalobium sp.]
MKRIEDALHGYIRLNDKEVEVLDSPEVQRLRRIRQLALSSMVYPSANHTRFEHSLGVMHFAGEFAESLELSEEMRQKVRYAGLLHDSGHGPFSHASEVVAKKKGYSHEDLSCKVIDELEDTIPVETGEIKQMIHGEHRLKVVAGDIDADRLDYLLRDAHSSGLEYGMIDHKTIISSAEKRNGEMVFDERAVPALESLFTSRFHMIKTLYSHHAATIAEKMLQRSLEALLEEKTVEEVMKMDDWAAHTELLNSETEAADIYSRIKDRNLYKTAVDWGEDKVTRNGLKVMEKRIEEPRKLEEKIAEEADVPAHEIIIDPPRTPRIHDINVKINSGESVKNLQEVSPIPESLKDAEWRTVSMKVYTPEEKVEGVREASEKVLKNYRNALEDYKE